MALNTKVAAKKASTPPVSYKSITVTTENLKVDGRTVCGYLAAFGNIDSDGDRLIPGCFLKSINERGPAAGSGNQIAHLWQHKMDIPLGKYSILREDEYGLYFECPYDDIQKANDALVQFQSGTLKNFSIGYAYVWDKIKWNSNDECFDVFEVVLWEGSVVTLAANEMALYVGMKGKQREDEISVLKEEFEDIIGNLKPRKRYELSQIFTKFIALHQDQPPTDSKEALRLQEEKKAKDEAAAQSVKKSLKLGKLSQLKEIV